MEIRWAAEAGVTAHFYIEQLQVFNIRTVSQTKEGHGKIPGNLVCQRGSGECVGAP